MGFFNSYLLLTTCGVAASDDPDSLECKPMAEIYTSGKDLCEKMWGESFVYEANESKGYTMWFLAENPNPATSATLFTDAHSALDVCHLDYNHKETPSAETLNECVPWADHGCCHSATVSDAQTLKEAQGGPEYHWDRCGVMSAGCERFFIEEACFYECEPAVGLFRKYPNEDLLHDRDGHEVHDPRCDSYSEVFDQEFADANCNMGWNGHNSWEVHRMPIKASYCDAFYDACKSDLFCGHGNFFECARVSPNATKESLYTTRNREAFLQEEAARREQYLQDDAQITDDQITDKIKKEDISVPEENSATVLGLVALALHF